MCVCVCVCVCVCIFFPNGISFSNEKETLPFLTTWRDLEDVMLRKTDKTEKEKNCVASLSSGI